MASAAAVAADQALSPPGNTLDEDDNTIGQVTSGIIGDLEEEPQNDDEQGLDDLFGEEDDPGEEQEEEPASQRKRHLDDEELDSGDDIDRADRAVEEPETTQYETHEKVTMDLQLPRQPVPNPTDDELYLLKIPPFLEIEPNCFQHTEFQPPATDHHSSKLPSSSFSAYNTAMTTIRWRHAPSNPAELQSNARILRWSDGSLTVQMASDPSVQYEIDVNPLAPPHRSKSKPMPNRGKAGAAAIEKYDASKDAFTYLVIPNEASSSLRVTHKITAGLSIKQSDSHADDAIERLQAALATAANANKVNGDAEFKLVEEDPEDARRRAEDAMRQKAKADRRREAAIQRETDRSNRTLGRHGLTSSRHGNGLNVGMLEDEDGLGRQPRPRAAPRQRRNRRGSEYSSDEDGGRTRFSRKEDEYDEEDDFVAPSDEEEEVIEDDDEDEDDGVIEEPTRRESPKRERARPPANDEEEDEEDAEGDPDEEVQQSRAKRRRVIDDDDEEEADEGE